MAAVSPLTTNVCTTCHETSALSTSYSIIIPICHQHHCEVTSSNVLGRNGGTGGGESVVVTWYTKKGW